MTTLGIKPFYRLREIAEAIGYTLKGTRGFLKRVGVPMTKVSTYYIVYLTDLQTFAPQFQASLMEARQLKSLLAEPESEWDNDAHTGHEFR